MMTTNQRTILLIIIVVIVSRYTGITSMIINIIKSGIE